MKDPMKVRPFNKIVVFACEAFVQSGQPALRQIIGINFRMLLVLCLSFYLLAFIWH